MKAYVIFDDSRSRWLKLLKPNYRHVSVLLPVDDYYIHIDPVKSRIQFRVVTQEEAAAIYDETVYYDIAIVQTDVQPLIPVRRSPAFLNCVELVKNVLGIRKWWIVTPYQLYNYITKGV